MTSDWLRWLWATAMIGVVLFHASRLVASRVGNRNPAMVDEFTHAAMSMIMAAMLIGVLGASDSRRLALAFAVPLLWFAWRGMHGYVMDGSAGVGAPVRQLIGCAAMIYMLGGLSARAGAGSTHAMAGMTMPATSTTPSSSLLTTALVVAVIGLAALTVVRPRAVGISATPALAAGCQLAMNAATVYMLVAM